MKSRLLVCFRVEVTKNQNSSKSKTKTTTRKCVEVAVLCFEFTELPPFTLFLCVEGFDLSSIRG